MVIVILINTLINIKKYVLLFVIFISKSNTRWVYLLILSFWPYILLYY